MCAFIDAHVEKKLEEKLEQAARKAHHCNRSAWHSSSKLFVPDTSTRERIANELQLSFVDVDDWIQNRLNDKQMFAKHQFSARNAIKNTTFEPAMLHLLDQRQKMKTRGRTNVTKPPKTASARSAPAIPDMIKIRRQKSEPIQLALSPIVHERKILVQSTNVASPRRTFRSPELRPKFLRRNISSAKRRARIACDLSPTARSKLQDAANHDHRVPPSPVTGTRNRPVSLPEAMDTDKPTVKGGKAAKRGGRRVLKRVRVRTGEVEVRPSSHDRSAFGLHQVLTLIRAHQPSQMGRAAWLFEHHRGRETDLERKLREGAQQRSVHWRAARNELYLHV